MNSLQELANKLNITVTHLRQKESLSLKGLGLTELPVVINELTNIRKLTVEYNQLTTLSDLSGQV